MIWTIVMLAAGVVLAVLAVLLRRKIGKTWMVSVLAMGLVLAVLGGWFLRGQLARARESREAVYLGLRCLERYDAEAASFYLRQADDEVEAYVTSAAGCLMERLRGNDLMARLDLDAARSAADGGEETSFLDTLQVLDVNNGEHVTLAAQRLIGFLGLKAQRQEALDLYLDAASGSYGWSQEELTSLGLDETDGMRLQVGAMMNNGAWEQAVTLAARLADQDPAGENRLLLAEAVAESAYQGVILYDGVFADQETGASDASVQEERQKLDQERTELETRLMELEIQSEGLTDQAALSEANEEKLALTEEIQDLQNRSDKLYIYRAFSSIADLRSIEADLVRARLYFALQQYDEAVETIRDSAQSLRAKLTTDRETANALQVVEQAYAKESDFQETQAFRDAVVQLLTAPFSDLMYVGQSALTQDFAQRIISDQKEYGQDLFLSALDLENYPTIRVTLSGREELLEQVVEKENVSARDTRQEISYTAEMVEGEFANICVAVDCSGSMDGTPIENLKTALDEFVRNMSDNTNVSLVAFESSARRLTDLTQDQALLLSTVQDLSGGGGTDITSGIREGIEVLSQAAGSRVMLLMTDGQSSVDASVVAEAAAAGITIHTIGFGSVNDQLLEEIAAETGGQYIRANSSSELSNVYASLQQVIGNVVVLTYTAEDTDTLPRYFFLRVDRSSVYREYYPGLEAAVLTPQLYTASPSLLTPDTVTQRAQRGDSFSFSFYGEDLLGITAAAVNGQEVEITDLREDQLRVSVPAGQLSSGWQTVIVTTKDGTEASFDRLLLVGESQYYRNIRLGSIQIPSAQGVLPGDGTLVLLGSGIRLQENVSAERSSLDLSVSGALILPWQQPAAETETTTDLIDLGDQGTITGWGLVTLNSGDGAYISGAPSQVAKGQLTLVCAPEQSQLIQGQEGGNN